MSKATYLYMRPEKAPPAEALAEGISAADDSAKAVVGLLVERGVGIAISDDTPKEWWRWIAMNNSTFPDGEPEAEPDMPSGRDTTYAELAKRLVGMRSLRSIARQFDKDDEYLEIRVPVAMCAMWHIDAISKAVFVLTDPATCALEAGEPGVAEFHMEHIQGEERA